MKIPMLRSLSFDTATQWINSPYVTISAVFVGLWLGIMQFDFLQYLRPVGDFYVAILQICVLPFLLATIPLAVRSALNSRITGAVMRRLFLRFAATVLLVAAIAVVVPSVIFHYLPMDQASASRIGALFGASTDQVDIEFDMNAKLPSEVAVKKETGILSVIPTNVFFALASDDSLRVVMFALIFGAGLVLSERNTDHTVFGDLRHIQNACIRIFDWFNLFIPIGIIALIGPQVALLGPEVYVVLAPFAFAFLASSAVLLMISILAVSLALRIYPGTAFARLLKPLALAAATRNTLICAPSALEVMKDEFHAAAEPCDLYIPIGFAVMRFGTMMYFIVATLFVGHLLGRSFSVMDLAMVATFSTMASFATLGASGLAALAPMAAVLRPFGLSYELAVPLMTIVDPIANMIRTVLNVALNCQVSALADQGGLPQPMQAVAAAE